MEQLIYDSIVDSLSIVLLLFIIYVLIEYIEHNYSHKIKNAVEKAGKAGPLVGAVAGSVPQCGFSVVLSALYSKNMISIGTLLAVYISTSDEAIPVILANPSKARVVIPLILTKIAIAMVAGFLIDAFYRKRLKKPDLEECVDEVGCCGHQCDSDKIGIKDILFHPMIHTLKIFFFVLVTTLLINYIIWQFGILNLQRLFLEHNTLQPIFTAAIGLIPNCASSVAIANLYLNDLISFGATISGLSAGAGLGLIVLYKENKDKKNTAIVLGLLLFISILSGILI